MKEHVFILSLFLFAAIVISIVFISIYKSSVPLKMDGKDVNNPTQKRFYIFIALVSLLLIFLSVTIPKSPYYLFKDESPSKTVYVQARQYYYAMSYNGMDAQSMSKPEAIELPVNEVVEFRVTSLDVNHGFAIYNQAANLITQTQVMPGYVNRLRWKFTEPGEYHILCLEFCGGGHAFMRGTFTVK